MVAEAGGPRFPLGQLVMTRGVAETLLPDDITAALR
jgi:hypothetical protein